MSYSSPLGSLIDSTYEVISRLGRGGTAEVFKARHVGLNRFVAIKFLQSELCGDQEWRIRFFQEGRVAASLVHPNIARCLATGLWHDKVPYLVFEFLEGETLRTRLNQQGSLDWRQSVDIAAQVCDALNYAHSHACIHRDIKPENIMLTSQNENKTTPKLLDFGLARILPESTFHQQTLTQTGELIGSVNYMSPEQCLGQPVSSRSDIYSLGCVLYECIQGKPPFVAESLAALMHKHTTELPQPLQQSHCDQAAQITAVLYKAMSKSADARYDSMQSFKRDLTCLLAGEEINSATALQFRRSSATGPQKHYVLAAITATGIVLVACLLFGQPILVKPLLTVVEAFGGSASAATLESLGAFWQKQGRWQAAESSYTAALRASGPTNNRELADIYTHLAACNLEADDEVKAAQYALLAIQLLLDHPTEFPAQLNEKLLLNWSIAARQSQNFPPSTLELLNRTAVLPSVTYSLSDFARFRQLRTQLLYAIPPEKAIRTEIALANSLRAAGKQHEALAELAIARRLLDHLGSSSRPDLESSMLMLEIANLVELNQIDAVTRKLDALAQHLFGDTRSTMQVRTGHTIAIAGLAGRLNFAAVKRFLLSGREFEHAQSKPDPALTRALDLVDFVVSDLSGQVIRSNEMARRILSDLSTLQAPHLRNATALTVGAFLLRHNEERMRTMPLGELDWFQARLAQNGMHFESDIEAFRIHHHLLNGQKKEALSRAKRAISNCRDKGSPTELARFAPVLGFCLLDSGKNKEALEQSQQLIEILKTKYPDEKAPLAQVYMIMYEACVRMDKWQEAGRMLSLAESACRSGGPAYRLELNDIDRTSRWYNQRLIEMRRQKPNSTSRKFRDNGKDSPG